MAEVIPASGDDWREIERRASLPEGHVERALLEILQRLVPVENQVVPVEARAATPNPRLSTDAAGRPEVSFGKAVILAELEAKMAAASGGAEVARQQGEQP